MTELTQEIRPNLVANGIWAPAPAASNGHVESVASGKPATLPIAWRALARAGLDYEDRNRLDSATPRFIGKDDRHARQGEPK